MGSVPSPADDGPVPPNNLPPPRRTITTHTPDGVSIFDTTHPQEIPVQILEERASAALAYVANVPLKSLNSKNEDLDNYSKLLADPPGLTIPTSAVLRFYDMAPGTESPLHRTTSIDYLVALIGEVQLTLDSGEKRVIKPGEVVIQRGTNHSWKNIGEGWSRFMAVTLPVDELVVAGEKKGEDLGGIKGLKGSE